jgi:hypothetical protein
MVFWEAMWTMTYWTWAFSIDLKPAFVGVSILTYTQARFSTIEVCILWTSGILWSPIIASNQASSYRLLDYYQHRTQDKYLNVITHYHFRKLLVTHIPKVRLMGIQEKMFASYLRKPTSGNYTALGYSIDGILRAFRVEGAVSLANGRYGLGIRLGLASNIGVNLGE